jgi:hypothetical protein
MFRKLTGILILLSFLTFKNSPLFVFDVVKQAISLSEGERGDNEVPEETKSAKHLEFADEDFLHQSTLNFILELPFSKRPFDRYVRQTSTAYFSLPYPPPDGNS